MSDNETKFEKNGFDLIRYWAVISIALLHYTGFALKLSQTGSLALQAIREVVSFFPGVVIFFSMSGFLVSASIERSRSKKQFIRKRIFRMYPEMWVCTIVNLIVIALLVGNLLDRSIIAWVFTQIVGFANTPTCLSGWATGSVNGALWTVFVQIQLYFVLALCYDWLKKRNLRQCGIILFAAAVSNVICQYIATATSDFLSKLLERTFVPYAIWFLIGVVIYQNKGILLPIIKKAAIPLLIVYSALRYLPVSIPGYYTNIMIGILCPLIVIGGGYMLPPIRIKADITYGMFLYHWIVLNVIVHFDLMNVLPWSLCLLLFLAVTILAGWASWRFIGRVARKGEKKKNEMPKD